MFELLVQYGDLYRDPILCALIAGVALGFLGVYVVSRRIVFVSAALSQTAALGVTLGFWVIGLVGLSGVLQELLPPLMAAVLCGLVVTLLVLVGDRPTLSRDALLGLTYLVPTALVLVLGPYIAQELHEVSAVLHGSAVLVRRADLWAIGIGAAIVLAIQAAAFRSFVFASLDPLVARTQGLPVRLLDALLFGSIALMTGLVTRALGALPTFALTVLPAIGALGLNTGLRRVFVIAATVGGLSGMLGYFVAFFTDWSVSASQALVAALFALLLRAWAWVAARR